MAIVPDKVKKNFITRELDSVSNQVTLLSLSDTTNQKYFDYVILKNITNRTENFIKAYPIDLIEVNEIKKTEVWEEYLPYLIDLKNFNEYVYLKGISDESEIVKLYCYILSDLDDPNSYRLIYDQEDIDQLLLESFPTNLASLKSLGYKMLAGQKIKFESNFKYCWFYNKGLIRFSFKFDKRGNLENVESKGIGYLGNEIPIIP